MDVLTPEIFDKNKILSGLTKMNKRLFPDTGLSLAPADILTEAEFEAHLRFFSESVNVPITRIKFNKQIHSDITHFVDEKSHISEGDALITYVRNLMIYVKIADCGAILIHDEINNVIAAVHSGWRGTKQKILLKTVKILIDQFGSNIASLKFWISPMAQQRNYEVQKEFVSFFPDSVIKDDYGKYYFSNTGELLKQLADIGIKKEQIEYSDICTIENVEFHSYRRDRKSSGRMAAFIMMK